MTITTTAMRCTDSPFGQHKVESDSSDSTYDVQIREDGRDLCNCVAFVIKRNRLGGYSAIGTPGCTCKHINRLRAQRGCGWTSETGVPAVYPKVCPVCSAPTEAFTPLSVLTEANYDDVMQALLDLKKRFKK